MSSNNTSSSRRSRPLHRRISSAFFDPVNQFCNYGEYHQNHVNQIIHFIFVPVITFSFIMMLVTRFVTFTDSTYTILPGLLGFKVDLATILVSILSVYYVILDIGVGLSLVVQLWSFIFIANYFHQHLSSLMYVGVIILCQVVGWTTQFVGHYIEGRRPALVDNLFQIFNAPFFVMIEAFFHFGYKPELYEKIKKELEKRNRRKKPTSQESSR